MSSYSFEQRNEAIFKSCQLLGPPEPILWIYQVAHHKHYKADWKGAALTAVDTVCMSIPGTLAL
jgi:hypothetical protein